MDTTSLLERINGASESDTIETLSRKRKLPVDASERGDEGEDLRGNAHKRPKRSSLEGDSQECESVAVECSPGNMDRSDAVRLSGVEKSSDQLSGGKLESLAMTPGKTYVAVFQANGTTYIEDLEVGAITVTGTTPSAGLKDYTLYSNATTTTAVGTTGAFALHNIVIPANTLTKNGDSVVIDIFGITAINVNAKSVLIWVGGSAIAGGATLKTNVSAYWSIRYRILRVTDTVMHVIWTLLQDTDLQGTNTASPDVTIPGAGTFTAGFTISLMSNQVATGDIISLGCTASIKRV